jgi:hypothetical protein
MPTVTGVTVLVAHRALLCLPSTKTITGLLTARLSSKELWVIRQIDVPGTLIGAHRAQSAVASNYFRMARQFWSLLRDGKLRHLSRTAADDA